MMEKAVLPGHWYQYLADNISTYDQKHISIRENDKRLKVLSTRILGPVWYCFQKLIFIFVLGI